MSPVSATSARCITAEPMLNIYRTLSELSLAIDYNISILPGMKLPFANFPFVCHLFEWAVGYFETGSTKKTPRVWLSKRHLIKYYPTHTHTHTHIYIYILYYLPITHGDIRLSSFQIMVGLHKVIQISYNDGIISQQSLTIWAETQTNKYLTSFGLQRHRARLPLFRHNQSAAFYLPDWGRAMVTKLV